MTKRKAFNFYRSYYEVLNELPDKDKLPYLLAILERQFNGTEPDLKGVAKLAYVSQKHSIDAQVAGYEAKTKTKLGGCEGGAQGASVQEKGQVEEKEKEEVKEKVQLSIEDRKAAFKNALLSNFIDQFEKELLLDFCEYWTEASPGARKMRFEKEKAFDVGRRLKTWLRNAPKFGQTKTKNEW